MKAVIVQAALAVLGLTFAYTTWLRRDESEGPKGDVEMFSCDIDTLSKIAFDTPMKSVVIEPRTLNDEKFYWFTVADKPNPHNKTPKAPELFVGNPAAKTYVEGLASLKALRSLGALKKETLKEFELDKPTTSLKVSCGKRTNEVVIGGRTYGTSDRYVRLGKKGPGFLLASAVASDLENASFRFMQRALHLTPLAELDAVTIKSNGKAVELIQRNKGEAQKAEWVAAADPNKRNELYGNWLNRLVGLNAETYLKIGQQPGAELPTKASGSTQLLQAEYKQAGRVIDTVEFVRIDNAGTPAYYARTKTTRLWVKLVQSAAKQVEDDLAAVLSGEVKNSPTPGKGQAGAPLKPGQAVEKTMLKK